MRAGVIFKEVYGERELVMNSLWNWIHKWDIYNNVITRKKYELIKGAPTYEIVMSDFREANLTVMMREVVRYSTSDLNNFFNKNENIDEILIPVNVIIDGETFKYSVGIYRDAYKDIYPTVKIGY